MVAQESDTFAARLAGHSGALDVGRKERFRDSRQPRQPCRVHVESRILNQIYSPASIMHGPAISGSL